MSTMRSHLSALLLRLQPLFLLLVPVALALLVSSTGLSFAATLVTVIAAAEGARAVQAFRRRRHEREMPARGPAEGVAVTRADGHAQLWGLVDSAATAAAVPPPGRVVLSLTTVLAVNPLDGDGSGHADAAAIRRGQYELLVSPVLLTEASIPELQAVLVHELTHRVAAGSAESAPVTRLVATRVRPIYRALPPGMLKLGAWLHLQLWLRVDTWAGRPASRLADDVTFRTCGPTTTAAALDLVDRIGLGQEVVLRQYLPLAVRARLRPSIIMGVHELLQAPPSAAFAHRIAGRGASRHVTAAERALARGVGAEADLRASQWAHVSAVDLVDGGPARLVGDEVALLNEDHLLLHAPEADWETVVDVGWRSTLADLAMDVVHSATMPADAKGRPLPLDGPVPAPVPAPPADVSTGMVLAAVDRMGQGRVAVGRVMHDPDADEQTALSLLRIVSARALDRGGRLRARLSWSGPAVEEYFDGSSWLRLFHDEESADAAHEPSPVEAAVRQVVAGAPTQVLLDALLAVGADVDGPIAQSTDERSGRPGTVLGAHAGAQVRRAGSLLAGSWVVVITTTGVWLVPEHFAGSQLDPAREEAQRDLMRYAARAYAIAGGPDHRIWPRSWWLAEVELAEVTAHGDASITAALTGTDATVTRLELPAFAPSLGTHARHALREMVGNRMLVD